MQPPDQSQEKPDTLHEKIERIRSQQSGKIDRERLQTASEVDTRLHHPMKEAEWTTERATNMQTDYQQRALAMVSGASEKDKDSEDKDAADPHKISKRRHQRIVEQLENGEIPQFLEESWFLVDPESEDGRDFQEKAQSLAEVLYASDPSKEHLPNYELRHHDFQKEPVRFLLSDQEEANAWYVRGSNPPIIVFTKGLFRQFSNETHHTVRGKRLDEDGLVGSPHDFAAVLCHEMTHMKLRRLYGEIPNSKIEEGIAYSVPLLIMGEKGKQIGLNPERCLSLNQNDGIYERIRLSRGTGVFTRLRTYMDVHPTADNTYSIASNTVAHLRK